MPPWRKDSLYHLSLMCQRIHVICRCAQADKRPRRGEAAALECIDGAVQGPVHPHTVLWPRCVYVWIPSVWTLGPIWRHSRG